MPEDKIKFYIHWVWKFLKSCNYQLENINTDRISQYLDSLETEKVKDWQVKQAADAVILYAEKYLKRSLQQVATLPKDPDGKPIDPQGSLQWKQTLEEVRSAIRLRHLSFETKSFLTHLQLRLILYLNGAIHPISHGRQRRLHVRDKKIAQFLF